MSPLPISYLVDDAARKIGDPNKNRVTPPDWLAFYNQSIRELCQKANVLKYRGIFTLDPTALYAYPEEATQITAVEITETPANLDSFRFLGEYFEDEFRGATTSFYPNATIPDHYFADANWFYLIPRPTAQIVGGGRVTYFGLPDRVFDLAAGTFQLPWFTQDYVIRRMVVYGLEARNRLVEATAALKGWYADMEGLADSMDDRSQDRRSGIRPAANPYSGMH